MLDATHDPIGDFVNAATSDVVAFTGRHDFETFKRNTGALNELATYRQLVERGLQCGYRINKVVYRGYGSAEEVVTNFKRDLHSAPAKKIHAELKRLGLPTLNDIKDEFEAKARELGIDA